MIVVAVSVVAVRCSSGGGLRVVQRRVEEDRGDAHVFLSAALSLLLYRST